MKKKRTRFVQVVQSTKSCGGEKKGYGIYSNRHVILRMRSQRWIFMKYAFTA